VTVADVDAPGFDVAGFARALADRRPDYAAAELRAITKFPRGVSRETWFVEFVDVTAHGSLVVRRDLPGGAVTPTPLRLEYEIYRRLRPSDVPVAETLWFEDDPERMIDGRPFYVRRHVEGHWDVPHFGDPDPAYDDLRIEVSKEHLRRLAAIHTCDWRALGFDEIMEVPPSPELSAATAIDRLVDLLATFQVEAFPLVTEAIEVLRDRTPRDVPRIALLKGTNGIGEEVWRDGRIVAMSDWELAYLGDPASDFAHIQRIKPTVTAADGSVRWDMDRAIAYYEEISGIPVTRERVDYYRAFGALEMVLYTHNSCLPLLAGTDRLVRRSWVSTEVLHGAQTMLADLVRAA